MDISNAALTGALLTSFCGPAARETSDQLLYFDRKRNALGPSVPTTSMCRLTFRSILGEAKLALGLLAKATTCTWKKAMMCSQAPFWHNYVAS